MKEYTLDEIMKQIEECLKRRGFYGEFHIHFQDGKMVRRVIIDSEKPEDK